MLHRTECKTTRIFLGYNHELHDLLGKHQMLCHLESRQSWICCLSILDRKASLFLNIILSLHASVILNNMGNRKLHQIPLLLLPVIKSGSYYSLDSAHLVKKTFILPIMLFFCNSITLSSAFSTAFFTIFSAFTLKASSRHKAQCQGFHL